MKAVITCTEFNQSNNNQSFFAPLVQLANGETVLERQVRLLYECGFTQFYILSDIYHEQLIETADNPKFKNVNIEIIDEDKKSVVDDIFTLTNLKHPWGEETVFLSGDLVFNRGFIKGFFNGNKTDAVAIQELSDDSSSKTVAKVFNNYIETVMPKEMDNRTCFDVMPLVWLSSQDISIQELRAVSSNDHLLKQIVSSQDSVSIEEQILRFDLFEQLTFNSVYSLLEVEKLLSNNGIKNPIVVTDMWEKGRFLKLCLENTTSYTLFDLPKNTNYEDTLTAVQLYQEKGCDAIVSFGSDNAIENAKIIRLLLGLNKPEDILLPNVRLNHVLHIAIPCMFEQGRHGIPEISFEKDDLKQTIKHGALLPDYVILEPKFLESYVHADKKTLLLDTICRCGESLWAVNCDERNKPITQRALNLALDGMIKFLNGSIGHTAHVLRAWHLSVKSVYMSGVTAAYEVGCRIAEEWGIGHGPAVALCTAHFWNYYAENITKSRDTTTRKKLAASLNIIKSTLKLNTNYELLEKLSFLAIHVLEHEKPKNIGDRRLMEILQVISEDKLQNTPINMSTNEMFDLIKKASDYNYLWEGKVIPKKPYTITSFAQYDRYWKSILLGVSVDGVKEIELDILNETVDICEQNNLSYFLSYDTLLGAVQNEGFTPWNYQINISMPRNDWEQLMTLFGNKKISEDLYVHYSENDDNCWFDYARICKKGTFTETSNDRFFYSYQRAIFINVHPMDSLPNRGFISRNRHKLCRLIDAVVAYRLNPASKKLTRKGRLFFKMTRALSIKKLHVLCKWMQGRKEKGAYGILGHQYEPGQEIIPKKLLYPLTKISFEGREYNAPCNPNAVAKRIYGKDYSLAEDITNPKLMSVSFDSEQAISFIAPQNAGKPGKENTVGNGLIKKLLRKYFGRFARVMDRTKTRISGFFRTIGIRFTKKSRLLASYKNKYEGQRCFLIGNGPSLTAEDLDKIQNEYSFGCNLIHMIYEQTEWRPTFLCISDSGITRTNSRQITENIDRTTLMIREFAYRYLHVKPWDAVCLPYISVDWYKVRGNMLAYHYISHATVMSMMIELAFYMGFKEIYLIGVDGTSASAKGSHFTDNYFSKAMKEYGDNVKKKLYKNYIPAVRAAYLQNRSLEIFKQLREYADKHDIKIYNATRGGYVEVFERADFDSLVK